MDPDPPPEEAAASASTVAVLGFTEQPIYIVILLKSSVPEPWITNVQIRHYPLVKLFIIHKCVLISQVIRQVVIDILSSHSNILRVYIIHDRFIKLNFCRPEFLLLSCYFPCSQGKIRKFDVDDPQVLDQFMDKEFTLNTMRKFNVICKPVHYTGIFHPIDRRILLEMLRLVNSFKREIEETESSCFVTQTETEAIVERMSSICRQFILSIQFCKVGFFMVNEVCVNDNFPLFVLSYTMVKQMNEVLGQILIRDIRGLAIMHEADRQPLPTLEISEYSSVVTNHTRIHTEYVQHTNESVVKESTAPRSRKRKPKSGTCYYDPGPKLEKERCHDNLEELLIGNCRLPEKRALPSYYSDRVSEFDFRAFNTSDEASHRSPFIRPDPRDYNEFVDRVNELPVLFNPSLSIPKSIIDEVFANCFEAVRTCDVQDTKSVGVEVTEASLADTNSCDILEPSPEPSYEEILPDVPPVVDTQETTPEVHYATPSPLYVPPTAYPQIYGSYSVPPGGTYFIPQSAPPYIRGSRRHSPRGLFYVPPRHSINYQEIPPGVSTEVFYIPPNPIGQYAPAGYCVPTLQPPTPARSMRFVPPNNNNDNFLRPPTNRRRRPIRSTPPTCTITRPVEPEEPQPGTSTMDYNIPTTEPEPTCSKYDPCESSDYKIPIQPEPMGSIYDELLELELDPETKAELMREAGIFDEDISDFAMAFEEHSEDDSSLRVEPDQSENRNYDWDFDET